MSGRRRSVLAVAAGAAFAVTLAMATSAAAGSGDTDVDDVDLSSGWVSGGADLQGKVAVHPDLGVVVVGSAGEWPPVSPPAWYSPDGLNFEEVSFPAPTGDPIDARRVAVNDRGFVALLSSPPFASYSEDGRVWEPIALGDLMPECGVGVVESDAPTDGSQCTLRDVAAGPAGFVLLGNNDETCDGLALQSVDGRRWQRAEFPENCSPVATVAMSDGFLALVGPTQILSSGDGLDWDEATATGLPADLEDRALWQLSARGDTVVLVGTRSTPECDFVPGVWSSSDGGQTWAEGSIEPSGDPTADAVAFQPEDIDLTEFGFVAVGRLVSGDSPCGPVAEPSESGLILVSSDGVTWRQFATDFGLSSVAATSTGLIGSGGLGIITWAPGGEELATTGFDDIALLIGIGAALTVAGTMALLIRRVAPSE